jgi:hypothetical protein
LHVLKDCAVAKDLWMMKVVPLQNREEFFGGELSHRFKFNLQGDLAWIADIRWPKFWATVFYYLWVWRNKDIHDDNFVKCVMHRWREYRDADKAKWIEVASKLPLQALNVLLPL